MRAFNRNALRLLGGLILLGGITAAQDKGGTLTVGLSYDLDTLDSYASGFLTDVQSTFLEPLIYPDENARYQPAMATEVPTQANRGIRISADGKKMTVTYKLRPGLKWADGEPVTSSDIKFTWEAIKDPKYLGSEKDGTEEIEKIDTPDPLTAVISYNQVYAGFKASLFGYGILPEHVLKGKDLNKDPFWDKPFGAGPFKVTEFKRGQYVILDRNPNYWRKDASGTQLPYLDRVIFKIIPNTNTLVTQLKSGEINFAYGIPFTLAPSVDNVPGIKVVRAKTLRFMHLTYNFKNEFLKDLNVRKAIAQAVDRDAINKAGFYTPLERLLLKQHELRNAAMCLADIRLHRGAWNLGQMRTFYTNQVGVAPGRVWSETTRNSIYPATRLMYWLGTREIKRHRLEIGGSPRSFHDALLSFGSVPVHWVANELSTHGIRSQG